MKSRERLLNTLSGKKTDRIPVFTQIPFALSKTGFSPGPFHGYEDPDNWRETDPLYRELVKKMESCCDNFFIWRPKCMNSDHFFIPSSMINTTYTTKNDGLIEILQSVQYKYLDLTQRKVLRPGTGHTWQLEHFCKSVDDAKSVLDLPFEDNDVSCEDFIEIEKLLDDKGVIWVTVPSPLLVVCRLFDPSEFLMLVATERTLLKELMHKAYERIYAKLELLLIEGAGPIIRFGGAEHATPPLMSENDFDRLVVEYDKPLIDLCKKYDRMTAVQCHGNIKHALKRFVQMGVDQTDPVETIPDGNITLKEAREISGDRITLTGNIQMRELYSLMPSDIENRVKQIIDEAGTERLIISTTGTPLEKMTYRLASNYHSLIDSALKYGR